MNVWTDAMVAAAVGVDAAQADVPEAPSFAAISTDTRTLGDDTLFVALRGETHDGHAYLAQAAERGARGAVVDHVPAGAPAALRYYVVADTLVALARLGRMHRRRIGARVCAVAGSNGKTTTKDMLRAVMSTRYRVHATPGNFNNLIGAPLTLLGAPDDTDVIIAEIGTNVPGEIGRLAGIVEPDAAVITGISAEHLEGLGDLDGVLREETALLPWLPADAPAIVADEPPVLADRARRLYPGVRVAGLGEQADAELRGSNVELDGQGRVGFRWRDRDVRLQLRGRHNARNALLALGIGAAWGVDATAAIAALGELEPGKLRTEFHTFGDMLVIADCYNANPASLAAAIDLLVSLPREGRRVAVLGSMLEMGAAAADVHRTAARAVADAAVDLIVATGAFVEAFEADAARLGDRIVLESDPLRAYDRFAPLLTGTEVVLLKGSRGVALERLLARFDANMGVLHPHGEANGPRASTSLTGERGDAPSAGRSQNSADESGA